MKEEFKKLKAAWKSVVIITLIIIGSNLAIIFYMAHAIKVRDAAIYKLQIGIPKLIQEMMHPPARPGIPNE